MAIQAVNSTQSGQITAIEALNVSQGSQINELYGITAIDRREARRGTAAAVALATAPIPSAPGKTSYSFNLANYRNQQAAGLALAHRLNTKAPMAITFGISHAGGKNTAVRAGLSGEF